MISINVSIKSIVPLLQAKHPTPDEETEILKRLSNPKAKVKDMTEEEKFNMHAYRIDNKFVQPGEMIEACMVKAAVQYKMEGKKTYKDSFKAGVIVEQEMIIHKNQKISMSKDEPKDQKVWHMDARWAKNPSTRGAIWVVRPRINEWDLDFTLNVLLDELIPTDIIKEVLTYAGMYVGIGAWRPKFGRFEVVKFNVNK